MMSGEQTPPPSPHPSCLTALLGFDLHASSVHVVVEEGRELGVVVWGDSGHGENGVEEGQRCVPDGSCDRVGVAAGLGGRAQMGVGGLSGVVNQEVRCRDAPWAGSQQGESCLGVQVQRSNHNHVTKGGQWNTPPAYACIQPGCGRSTLGGVRNTSWSKSVCVGGRREN